jgi:hypothetical protein
VNESVAQVEADHIRSQVDRADRDRTVKGIDNVTAFDIGNQRLDDFKRDEHSMAHPITRDKLRNRKEQILPQVPRDILANKLLANESLRASGVSGGVAERAASEVYMQEEDRLRNILVPLDGAYNYGEGIPVTDHLSPEEQRNILNELANLPENVASLLLSLERRSVVEQLSQGIEPEGMVGDVQPEQAATPGEVPADWSYVDVSRFTGLPVYRTPEGELKSWR